MEFTDEPFAGLNGPVNLDFQPPFISDFQMISSILSLDLSQSILLADFNLTRFILQLLLFVLSLWLIFLVLIQRGKGGGLTGALGGSGGSSAFGAKAGDAFTRVTVVSATLWIFLCMVTIALINRPPPPEPAVSNNGAMMGASDSDSDESTDAEASSDGSGSTATMGAGDSDESDSDTSNDFVPADGASNDEADAPDADDE